MTTAKLVYKSWATLH